MVQILPTAPGSIRHLEGIRKAATSLHRTPFRDLCLREHALALLGEYSLLLRRRSNANLPRHLARLIMDEFAVIGDAKLSRHCFTCARSLIKHEAVIIGGRSRFTQTIVKLVVFSEYLRLLKRVTLMLGTSIPLRQIALTAVVVNVLRAGRGQLSVRFGFKNDSLREVFSRLIASKLRSLFLLFLWRL